MSTFTVVTVTLEDRGDGGLRVFSDTLPGLILSGADKKDVCACIIPAIGAIFEHKGLKVSQIRPSTPIVDVLKRPSPRNMDMHVNHEQFVVEFLSGPSSAALLAHG